MKVALQDKKAISALKERKPYEGRVLISTGDILRATWGDKPIIAYWEGGLLKKTESNDKGVRKVQETFFSEI